MLGNFFALFGFMGTARRAGSSNNHSHMVTSGVWWGLPSRYESAIPRVRSCGLHFGPEIGQMYPVLPNLPLTHLLKWTAKDIQK